jgi:hypothetical protein
MEGRKVFALVVLGTASAFIILAFFVALKSGMMASGSQKATGFIIAGKEETRNESRDIIEINNDELVKCCSFKNELGKEDSCFVLKRYDCSYCEDACEKKI